MYNVYMYTNKKKIKERIMIHITIEHGRFLLFITLLNVLKSIFLPVNFASYILFFVGLGL